jgi:peptidoglycan/LPS O-acetylase OafA/YrhL
MEKKNFDPGLSIYLDLMRFLAATVVLLSHTWSLVFPDFPVPWPGHSAVVIFFVLSGYVIGHVSDRPGTTARVYARHRAARILSVSLPALLLAIAIAPFVGTHPIHAAGDLSMDGATFWRSIWINMFFLGQVWTNNIFPPYNVPFWSLTYEVWYYAIFGAWKFGGSKRVLLTLIVAAMAGPLILLMMPVWLLGVALSRRMPRLSQGQALALFAATLVLGFAFFWTNFSINFRQSLAGVFPDFIASLNGSNQFVGDFLLGLIVSAHFIAVASLGGYLNPLLRAAAAIRTLASFTLSSYLYHLPLTVLLWNGLGVRSPALFYCLLFAGIVVLGSFTERQLPFYRRQLDRIFARPALAV